MEESGPPTVQGVRTSSRAKVKSQRALESEDTNRLLAIAKARARAEADGSALETSYTSAGAGLSATATVAEGGTAGEGSRSRKKAASQKGRKGSRKTRKEEVYCLCKSAESDRPMIECGHCNDWFHFDCIDLKSEQAETIHTYICPTCTSPADPALKTSYIYDISNFRSPTPPPGLPPTPVKRKKPLRKSGPKSKIKAGAKRAGSASDAGQSSDNDASGSEAEASSSASSSSGDDSDEADASSASDSGSDVSSSRSAKRLKTRTKRPPVNTRARPSMDGSGSTKAKRSSMDLAKPIDSGRRPSGPSKRQSVSVSNPKSGVLPPARQFVLDKLITLAQAFFAGMTASDAKAFAVELESSLFANFKEVKDGKVVPAAKYKTQFNLLTSALNSSLRTDVRDRILSRDLSPSSIATLSSAELASQERYLEMEKARLEVLQQTVRQKADGEDVAIRMGRDGVERAEDRREMEMERVMRLEEEQRERARRQEEEAREAAEQAEAKAQEAAIARRESASAVPPSPMNAQTMNQSPAPGARTISTPLESKASSGQLETGISPSRPTFNITSAWGGPDATSVQGPSATPVDEDDLMLPLGGDQSILDLSDLIALEPETGTDQAEVDATGGDEPMQLDDDKWERFEQGPVVWSGGLVVPYSPAPAIPTAYARVIASAQPQGVSWTDLLPRDPLAFTARLSSAAALKFLSDCRLDPSKEMYAVAFTLKPGSSDEEKKGWTHIVEDHLKRDRYMSYRPDGEDPQNPRLKPRREVYFIPLRPGDPSPEITGLIDGYAMPTERKESVFLALYVLNRGAYGSKSRDSSTAVPPTSLAAAPPSGSTTPVIPPPPPAVPAASAAPPVIQNDQLQALLGKLNPAAFQSIVASPLPDGASVGGLRPIPGGAPYPPPGPQGAPPPGQYGAYPQYGQDDRDYADAGHSHGPPEGYGYGRPPTGGNQHGRQGSWDRGHAGPGHNGGYHPHRQGPYDQRRDDRGDWGRGGSSGWSNRPGRGH